MTAYQLHDHQVAAVKHLHANPRAGLFLPMGAGKTLSVLDALTSDHLPALVVAPKQVAEHVWPEQTQRWRPELSLAAAVGSPAQRLAAIKAGADITVISRDNLVSLLSVRGKPKYRTIVLDESQSFKTRSSQRWKAARKLTNLAENVWALTGTPAGNGLMDLWAQLYLIDNGERLHDTLTKFRSRYWYPKVVLPNGVVAKWELKDGAEKAIYKAIEDVCLHIPLDDLDLPEKVVNVVPVGMPAKAHALYYEMKQEMVGSIELIGGVEMFSSPSAGVLSSKLSQITAGGIYRDRDDEGNPAGLVRLHDEKLTALKEIVEQADGPVLVFYRFRFEQEAILKAIPQATMVTSKGAIDAWNRRELPVMVAHPASAGHGLNLQYGGNTCVWTSLSWSMEEWEQANARLHRQGQRNRVMVHVLTVPGTMDENVLAALEKKVSVQQALLDALV
jgi:hypothetical protein